MKSLFASDGRCWPAYSMDYSLLAQILHLAPLMKWEVQLALPGTGFPGSFHKEAFFSCHRAVTPLSVYKCAPTQVINTARSCFALWECRAGGHCHIHPALLWTAPQVREEAAGSCMSSSQATGIGKLLPTLQTRAFLYMQWQIIIWHICRTAGYMAAQVLPADVAFPSTYAQFLNPVWLKVSHMPHLSCKGLSLFPDLPPSSTQKFIPHGWDTRAGVRGIALPTGSRGTKHPTTFCAPGLLP